MKRGRRREIFPANEEMVEKGDFSNQRREDGEEESYQTVKRGWRRVILQALERVEKGDLTRQ